MAINPSNKVKTESIDEVILRLLGLNPGTELDYQTYFNILKKKLVISRLAGNRLPDEEDKLLRSELKRVGVVKNKGIRFKVKKTKVKSNKENSSTQPKYKKLPPSGAIIKYKKGMISPREIIPVSVEDITEKKDQKKTGFFGIRKTLDSILKILALKFKFEQKQTDKDKRDKEREKRGKGESILEGFKKGISGIVSITKKLLSPFQDIINKIWRFIFFTLLGRAFTQFMNWLGNPANKKKVDVLGRFLRDWWPVLFGAAVLFFTPFGKFVRSVLGIVGSLAGKLIKQIPKIANAVKGLGAYAVRFAVNNPLLTIGLVTGVSAAVGQQREQQRLEDIAKQQKTTLPKRGQEKSILDMIGAGFSSVGQLGASGLSMLSSGGEIPRLNYGKFASGGSIPKLGNGYDGIDQNTGQKVSGFGPDTQMIVAQPGEIVMNKKTVDAVGADNLLSLNRMYGGPGANKPKISKMYFNGGLIGGDNISGFANGGMIGGNKIYAPIQNISNPNILNNQIFEENPNFNISSNLLLNKFPTNHPKQNNIDTPKKYQDGGVVENIKGFFNRLLNFGRNDKQTKRPPIVPKTNLPLSEYQNPEVLALLKTIRTAEHYSSSNPYISIYGGGTAPVTQMTIQEVIQMGNTGKLPKRFGGKSAGYGSGSTATGAYQFMPFTLQDLIRRGVAKPNEILSPSVQDRLGWELAKGRGVSLNALKKTGLNQSIMDMMAPEWASFPYSVSGGKSYYGQPVKGSDFLRGTYLQDLKSRRVNKRQKGGLGLVKENTGSNIRGATADRQLTALQPGEYVLPVDTVNRLGISFVEKLVAMTDSNSDAYLKKGMSRSLPEITPLYGNGNNMIVMPPIDSTISNLESNSAGNSVGAGSRVPKFSATYSGREDWIPSMYGLIG